jgi:sugar phosphate isomerase/epimerase
VRLCLNDSGLSPKSVTREKLKVITDIGFRVVGVGGGLDTTDDEIKRCRDLFAEAGVAMGPLGMGATAIHPDKAEQRRHMRDIARALEIGGKLGCPSLRYSVGSMSPDNIWVHHPLNHTQQTLDELVENTRELVPIAEDTRCALCPETTQWTIVGSPERMREFVDRLDSPYALIILDPVNHMTSQRVYDNGSWVMQAVGMLGDRIGVLHVKDVKVNDHTLVSHIDEAPMSTGLLDHAAVMRASTMLEPWKTFSLEHFNDSGMPIVDQWKRAYRHIDAVAKEIGHTWDDPMLTRERWEAGR